MRVAWGKHRRGRVPMSIFAHDKFAKVEGHVIQPFWEIWENIRSKHLQNKCVLGHPWSWDKADRALPIDSHNTHTHRPLFRLIGGAVDMKEAPRSEVKP